MVPVPMALAIQMMGTTEALTSHLPRHPHPGTVATTELVEMDITTITTTTMAIIDLLLHIRHPRRHPHIRRLLRLQQPRDPAVLPGLSWIAEDVGLPIPV